MNFREKEEYIIQKYEQDLYTYLKDLFEQDPLPSHDHKHHLRVWKYALQLCRELDKTGKEISKKDLEALIFACFFHDAGMVKTREPEHGKAGIEIFENFIHARGFHPPLQDEIKEAIEKHDDKTYRSGNELKTDDRLNLLTVLGIADDLDAFGNIGIYRYSEIYLMRGIPMEDLGLKVIANLSGRFNNFMFNCRSLPVMVKEHTQRYSITESFFRHYNLQIRSIEEGVETPEHGPVGVVRHIFRQVMMTAGDIRHICENAISMTDDVYTSRFFNKLKEEDSV